MLISSRRFLTATAATPFLLRRSLSTRFYRAFRHYSRLLRDSDASEVAPPEQKELEELKLGNETTGDRFVSQTVLLVMFLAPLFCQNNGGYLSHILLWEGHRKVKLKLKITCC
jgi:hypothetical protein